MSSLSRVVRQPFDRSEHVYENDVFVELVKDAIRFFNGTPVHVVPPPERFLGSGVYCLYYTGDADLYRKYAELNRLSYNFPIYVGKAVPKGWRQSRGASPRSADKLYSRIREHANSIRKVDSLRVEDFACRFVIFEQESSAMIGSIEAALIKLNMPLWNSFLDGFGNHTPGRGRFEQAKSDWDVIHPGRKWAEKCKGAASSRKVLLKGIKEFLGSIGETTGMGLGSSGEDAFRAESGNE